MSTKQSRITDGISQTESLAYDLALGFRVLGLEPYLVVFGHEAERRANVVTRLAARLVVVAPVEPVGLDARWLGAEPRGEYQHEKENRRKGIKSVFHDSILL